MIASNALKATLLFFLTFQLCGVSAKPAYSLAVKRSPSRASFSESKSLELEYSTNGKRMAAGLSPHTPTRPFNPSRVVARDPQTSPILYPGKILSRDASTGALVGYMSKTLSSGKMQVTVSAADALPVSLTFTSSTEVLGLRITDNSPTWPWVAIQGSPLVPTSNGVIAFMRSNMVAPGSGPTVAGTNSAGTGPTETHVFKFNPSTNEITAIWVNPPNRDVIDAYFYVSTGTTKFHYLSGNPNMQPAQTGARRVRLYLEA